MKIFFLLAVLKSQFETPVTHSKTLDIFIWPKYIYIQNQKIITSRS